MPVQTPIKQMFALSLAMLLSSCREPSSPVAQRVEAQANLAGFDVTVVVTAGGTGSGRVVSEPAGLIDCVIAAGTATAGTATVGCRHVLKYKDSVMLRADPSANNVFPDFGDNAFRFCEMSWRRCKVTNGSLTDNTVTISTRFRTPAPCSGDSAYKLREVTLPPLGPLSGHEVILVHGLTLLRHIFYGLG